MGARPPVIHEGVNFIGNSQFSYRFTHKITVILSFNSPSLIFAPKKVKNPPYLLMVFGSKLAKNPLFGAILIVAQSDCAINRAYIVHNVYAHSRSIGVHRIPVLNVVALIIAVVVLHSTHIVLALVAGKLKQLYFFALRKVKF